MSFNFIIPLSIDELQQSLSPKQFFVQNVYTANEIQQNIKDLVVSFSKNGPRFILQQDNFDGLYSALVNFKSIDAFLFIKIWNFVLKVIEALEKELSTLLEEESTIPNSKEWLMTLKMNTYIACTLAELAESKNNDNSSNLSQSTKKITKKSKKMKINDSSDVDWEVERMKMLQKINALIQPPLNRLWSPPIMDEDFVNLIANCCYKMLETPSVVQVRCKDARDTIFQIVGLLVKKHNHGLACGIKFMQLLRHFEHFVNASSQGVVFFVGNFNNEAVLHEMIREIIKTDLKDTSACRNYSQFLIEVAERMPRILVHSLPQLVSFLAQEDSYSMRNCVLSVMGSILRNILKEDENLDEKQKSLRDDCIEYLLDHVHDIHAFVRSKVLQIWLEIVESNCIPLNQQQPLVEKVVGRLEDRSSIVRKYSIQLLISLLKANPFAAKLPLEELQEQFEKEKKKLQELRPDAEVNLEMDELSMEEEINRKKWEEHVPNVFKSLRKVVRDESESDESSGEEECNGEAEEEAMEVDENVKENGIQEKSANHEMSDLNLDVETIIKNLMDRKYSVAIRKLQKVIKSNPDLPILKVNPGESATSTSVECSLLSDKQQEVFILLQRMFESYLSMKQQQEIKSKTTEEQLNSKKNEVEYKKAKMMCCYLRDSIHFATEINKGLPYVCRLLCSVQTTDVLEAIDFFVTAFEFGVQNAMLGVKKMMSLIWSKESTIKEAVVLAYKKLYINVDVSGDRARSVQIIKNLSALIYGATLAEMSALEDMFSCFFKSHDIDKQCIKLLWERYTKALPDTTSDEAKASIILLNFAGKSQPSILRSNLNILMEVGLGERGLQDTDLFKYSCIAIAKTAHKTPKTTDIQNPVRMNQDHELFSRVSDALVKAVTTPTIKFSTQALEEGINMIYILAEHPEAICKRIIVGILNEISKINQNGGEELFDNLMNKDSEVENNKNESNNSNEEGEKDLTDKTPLPIQEVNPAVGLQISVILCRFLTVVGQIALRQFIHLDGAVLNELKRRNYHKNDTKKKKKRKSRSSIGTNSSLSNTASIDSTRNEDLDEEMGLSGATADDYESDFIRIVCEKEIVSGENNLLAVFKDLITNICSNPTKYSDSELQICAALALSKFMVVSSECCEKNLQLLFTILEKSSESAIRANTITAIGDLTFRFPNLLEPWTPRIYARLRDEDRAVRQNTLIVLTQLILNDQVKVKGHISDIALCITDSESKISALSKTFFIELSKKGNALYNVLPDIISKLSDSDSTVPEKDFKAITGYIFSLIKKDRQCESFVEKLCLRLQASILERQWREISYCLSLLPYTEKGIRKLSENFNCYSDKLHENEVYDLLTSILSNSKKMAKPTMKMAVEEIEAKLQQCRNKGLENEEVATKASNVKRKSKTVKIKAKKSDEWTSSGSDDDDDVQRDNKTVVNGAPTSRSSKRISTKAAFKDLHDTSSESSE